MIRRWKSFNESTTQPFTWEMAQEILYYFSENSKPSKHIGDLFDKWGEIIENNFIMYETSYQEMKKMIEKMYRLCQEDEKFKDSMIEIYNEIRKERKDFPTASEIENVFSSLIEFHDFNFMIYSGLSKYEIKLNGSPGKNTMKLEDFINYCNLIQDPINKLNKYKTKLVECNFFDMRYSYCVFKVEITI
jgi:hypothetical protein